MTKKEKKSFNIYILGNSLVEKDSMPLVLLPLLKKSFPQINFIFFDPTEDFPSEKHLILLDTVINTKKVKILKEENIDKIQHPPSYSLHDFDLGLQIKILKKLNKLKEVTIIALPPPNTFSNSVLLNQLKKIISSLFSKNELHKRYRDHSS